MRRPILVSSHSARSSPLFTLPAADVLPAILAHLAPADLASLARTAACLRAPCTRALYARITLGSFGALCLLVRTLEARPALGELVRWFAEEEGRPFLLLDSNSEGGTDSEMLARALRGMPCLRALALASPLDAVSPELGAALRALGELESLRLGDATPETLDILAHVPPVRALCLRQRSVGWSDGCDDDGGALARYLLRSREVLTTLEIDGALLEPVLRAHPDARWPNVYNLTVYNCTSTARAAIAVAFSNAVVLLQQGPSVLSRCSSESIWDTRSLRVENPKTPGSLLAHLLRGPLVWMVLGALSGMLFLR